VLVLASSIGAKLVLSSLCSRPFKPNANMQTIGFQEAIEKISKDDSRYHPEAYVFLRDALEATLKRRKKARKEVSPHVGAAELLEGFRVHGLQEFGPMAITVLNYWGVRSSEDVGNMVFNLVAAGIFGKTDEDTIESFREGYDFVEAFVLPFRPEPKKLSTNGSRIVGKKA
jgi:uncharacterized repeat protein (TIGR04138 family)